MGTASNTIMPSKRVFKQYGQSGIPVSDWLPHIAEHVDDLAIIRSCWMDGLNHVGSVCQMNTGSVLAGRPALGAWATFGLGTAGNLPTFVVMADGAEVLGGAKTGARVFCPRFIRARSSAPRTRRFSTSNLPKRSAKSSSATR